jgi:hypothetical protein
MSTETRPPGSEEGPSLDLGDLDWTTPPDPTPGGSRWGAASLGWAARRFRHALGFGAAASALTGVTITWWLASGRMPTADPAFAVPALAVHIAAFLLAWVALRASVDTWQVLYLRSDAAEPPRANLTQILSVAAAIVMCFHAAMVVSSLLR